MSELENFHPLVHSQMAATARAVPGWSQEPGASPRFPTASGPALLLLQGHQLGAALQVKQPGLELLLLQDAGIVVAALPLHHSASLLGDV